MSDVTVAPAGGAPAPASNEVQITPNPVTPPQPVGSQAPDKPQDAPPSRREAIQRAYDRAANPPAKDAKAAEKPAPKPAEAKPGHNNPPEKTEQTFDLKKRPADQAEAQPRGERGQFAPRAQPDARQPAGQQAGQQPRRLPSTVPFHEPPARMAEHGKRDWHATPETVRGEVHRLAKEASDMYRAYKPDHDVMNTVRPFHEMATKQGTTLQRALTNYVTMEQKLRADVIGGLDVIVNNLNLHTREGQKLSLRDLAFYIVNQTPEQHKLIQQSNATNAAQQQIGQLHAEIAGLKTHLHQMHTQQQFVHTRSAVDVFADSHPRFDELGDLIEAELKLGFDLEAAYRRAELLRPTTHAAQTRTPSAQTRPADKSISGAPGVAPSNGASRSPKPVGRREAIQNAIRRHGGL